MTKWNEQTFIYRCYNSDNQLLYVGIAGDVTLRMERHQKSAWFDQVDRIDLELYPDRWEALRQEECAIKHERPIVNVIHNKPCLECMIE
jgi:predicted GIY-YIG superfamily endonuclease